MRILIASCVRQKEIIFREFLDSLSRLDCEGLDVVFAFVFHNWEEGESIVKDVSLPGNVVVDHYRSRNDYKTDEVTHHWNHDLITDMIVMKNGILNAAINNGFDYVFLVDSDLYLHPKTLKTLLSRKKDIIASLFWTQWQPGDPAMPNAWDYDHYSLLEGSIELWKNPGVYQVGGTGACILISSNAIKSGVRYDRIPNVSWWGEDRYFQLHASTRGFSIWIDTTCPIYHIYRYSDLIELQRFKQTLSENPMDDIRKKRNPKLSVSMVVRNEADRYLHSVLESIQDVADDIAIIDDHSTDSTYDICCKFKKVRILRFPSPFLMSAESTVREAAWKWALEARPDWILALDADEIIEEPERLRALIEQDTVDVWGFRRYDMWDPYHYRDDALWTGHHRLWPLLVRVFPGYPYKWSARALHASRVPENLGRFVFSASDVRIKHLGWMRPEDRVIRYQRYMEYDSKGEWGSKEQYESILDPNPNLSPW